jgi:hypothetical protein
MWGSLLVVALVVGSVLGFVAWLSVWHVHQQDYEVLLADVSGLLYDCERQGKVNDIRFILDVWSRLRLHLACANGHAGLVRLLLSCGTTNVASNESGNPGSTSLR